MVLGCPPDPEHHPCSWPEPQGSGSLVHQRRSAVDMDGRTGIHLEPSIQPLARTLPWRPHVHLLVFVHRGQGLEPGLYCLVRDPAAYDNLHNHLAPEATWIRQAWCPLNFPFYLLLQAPSLGGGSDRHTLHRVAEMKGHTFQDLYHFTLGGPVDDDRLVTRPPYAHLGDA